MIFGNASNNSTMIPEQRGPREADLPAGNPPNSKHAYFFKIQPQ
mgnify:CR=1 FL=1